MTGANKRQMHLGVFWLGTGNHSAGWRYDGAAASNCSWPVVVQGAQIAERGKFDLFFISNSAAMNFGDHPSFMSRFEPVTLIGALSAMTRYVGLGATISTSFSEPYTVARSFATVQHISGGRAACNIVTSTHDAAAMNFGKALAEHDLRYEVANEFVDVVKGLWDTWDGGAIIADKTTGTFLDEVQGTAAEPQGQVFFRQRSAQYPAQPARRSADHSGGRFGPRPGTFRADRRSGVFGGQRRQETPPSRPMTA